MRIFLVRHGESLGNVDETVYGRLQDHNVPLTQWGYEQAVDAGRAIQQYYAGRPDLAGKKARVWYSPFLRTAQTKDGLLQGLGKDRLESAKEDYLLREQDFGLFSDIPDKKIQQQKFPDEFAKYSASRKAAGKFYARPPLGESRADTAQRVRLFKETLMRDVEHGQEDVVIVAHGVTNRAFEMDFMHKGVKWLEDSPNPGNCDIVLIEGDKKHGYTASHIYSGKNRPPSLPKHYKAAAHEAGQAIS